ncbi:MAG: hypothetical protein K2Y27_08930 [Xanthobacteraceae bacterium]|nr:hypothetical protein [Xanthobacteraceae bacterium]
MLRPASPTLFNGANLTDAWLVGAELKGAVYDERTVFPKKPAGAGRNGDADEEGLAAAVTPGSWPSPVFRRAS